ncbi:MAG TPA: AAA domain-containing protein [Candidatus Cloacimonadota bacterium]|nr:AAA domain-containing protein [Candidatus Cloacimonadota bacterium]HQL14442.1 AAA domain-containing protein [Candidatus Cloacimonadota bacterium]
MSSQRSSLSSALAERLQGQLEELISSEASLTDRLFRCRQIMEEIFKAVTADTNIAFTGLYARMQYAYEASVLSPELNEQLQLLRLLTNKVVHHDDFEFGEEDFASAIRILNETVQYLSGNAQPLNPKLEEFIRKRNAKPLQPFRTVSEQTIEHIFGVVTEWKRSPAKANNSYLEITCQTSEGTQIIVTLWERMENINQGRRWTILDKALWRYCNISFYNLSLVQGVANRFQSTHNTLVILEPDFLMDVSAVADCFQNNDYFPEMFIISKFFTETITIPLARGKCVNYIFDELVAEPDKPLKTIFRNYLQENPQHVFALGEEAWNQIYDQIIAEHYTQLKTVAARLNKQNCQLEPSFISVKYGLHGRLDALSLPNTETDKYSILELKSGSAHPYDVWKAHQMQVVGYNLVLKEIFGAAKLANSSIFYSKSNETPLRHVVNNIQLEQDFLMCRNRIIGILQGLATKPASFVNWLKNNRRCYSNEFLQTKAINISSVLNSVSEDELLWFENKLKFIFREVWALKTGAFAENENGNYGFSSLWNCSPAEKKQQYRILANLWIEEVNDHTITFHRQDGGELSNLRIGDIVVLYKQGLPINEQQLIRGTLSYLDNEKVEVNTRCKINRQNLFDKYTYWAIEQDLMESSLYSGISQCFALLCAQPVVRNKLLGKTPPESEETDISAGNSWREDISACLKGMLAAKDYYLVQGPPGTGKTSCLLIQYLLHLVNDTEKKILLCCYTNRAVDEICGYLVKEGIHYIRLGKITLVSENYPTTEAFQTNRVFVSTIYSFLAAAPDLFAKIDFDEIIIDEASQIMEHHIIGLMSKIPKKVLIGDQNQLPPVILQQTDNGKESVLEKMIINANKKLFTNCCGMLTHHYRMHNDIAALVSSNYEQKLIPDTKRQHSKEPWLKVKDTWLSEVLAARVVWVETEPSLHSKADLEQAKWIKKFIECLAKIMPADEIAIKVGIISPFRAQDQCIISTLENRFNDITVDTVERFQGSERDCIIMSLPVRYSHELAMLQSINQLGTVDRKLNVAVSRAREQLIILGSSKILTQSEFYYRIYDIVQKLGKIIRIDSVGSE